MNETVIKVENLSKLYHLGELHKRTDSFREKVTNSFRHAFSSFRSAPRSKRHACPVGPEDRTGAPSALRSSQSDDHLWALRNVSFQVKRGEVLGIIGRNGAGKTTLLKILSRITKPTEGTARIDGRVGSLLEVGTGFHQELTGRENIFLNGAILGMTKAEIKRKFDEIVDFAEIEKFIDTPVKRYSSGMYVRLAFSVAAHLEPENLLIDEVLAVGDAAFQKKCLGKMGDVAKEGRTVLFVSHNMDAILSLCSIVYVIEGGRISEPLSPEEGVRHYLTMSLDQPVFEQSRFQLVHRPPIIHNLNIRDDDGHENIIPTGQGVRFNIELRDFADINGIACSIVITNQRNQRVVLFDTRYHANLILGPFGFARVSCYVPSLPLIPGTYYVDVILSDRNKVIEKVEQAAQFEVIFADILGTGRVPSSWQEPSLQPMV
jgi:lipopolysaccharide transport system ATP-binding protein